MIEEFPLPALAVNTGNVEGLFNVWLLNGFWSLISQLPLNGALQPSRRLYPLRPLSLYEVAVLLVVTGWVSL